MEPAAPCRWAPPRCAVRRRARVTWPSGVTAPAWSARPTCEPPRGPRAARAPPRVMRPRRARVIRRSAPRTGSSTWGWSAELARVTATWPRCATGLRVSVRRMASSRRVESAVQRRMRVMPQRRAAGRRTRVPWMHWRRTVRRVTTAVRARRRIRVSRGLVPARSPLSARRPTRACGRACVTRFLACALRPSPSRMAPRVMTAMRVRRAIRARRACVAVRARSSVRQGMRAM
jgi:hypothetical protein